MNTKIRHRAGSALLSFAIERSLERQKMESKLSTVARPGSTEHANALVTLAAARRFESVMLWVGWFLHPTRLLVSGADEFSY
jgi:hypothetical protein